MWIIWISIESIDLFKQYQNPLISKSESEHFNVRQSFHDDHNQRFFLET